MTKFIDWLLNDTESVKILVETRGLPVLEIARYILLEENTITREEYDAIQAILEYISFLLE